MSVHATAKEHKASLRSLLKSRRLQLAESERTRISTLICQRLSSFLGLQSPEAQGTGRFQSIALFWPLDGEVDLRPLALRLLQGRIPLCLPYIDRATEGFRVVTSLEELELGRFGISQPRATCAECRVPNVVVVPCLGFTRSGYRLGYGSGFYDRMLAATKSHGATSVLVGFDLSQVDVLPVEAHDIPCDWQVTESFTREANAPLGRDE